MAKRSIGALGLLAIPLLLIVFRKKATAAPSQAMPADIGAQYLAALQNNISAGGSYEEYVEILTDAYRKGALTQAQVAELQPRHPHFPQ